MQKQISKEMLHRLEKEIPPSWYYAGPTWNGLTPKKITLCNQEILIYKNQESSVNQKHWIGLAARCLHMNADLSCGRRRGNSILCPMHQWSYTEEGFAENYEKIHHGPHPKLKKYEVIERFGHLFVFIGESNSYPFPLDHLENFSVSSPIEVPSHAPLYLQGANGFDINHFPFVHGRKVEKILGYEQTTHSISIKYVLKNISPLWRDRLMRKFFNAKMILDFTVFGGNIVYAKISFGKNSYTLLTLVEPMNSTSSKAYMFAVTGKSNILKNTFQHLVLKYFIKKFFMHEVALLDGISLKESGLPLMQDPYLVDFFFWYTERLQFLSGSP